MENSSWLVCASQSPLHLAETIQEAVIRLVTCSSQHTLSYQSPVHLAEDHAKGSSIRLRLCLVPSQNAKFFKILRHIESLDACMKH